MTIGPKPETDEERFQGFVEEKAEEFRINDAAHRLVREEATPFVAPPYMYAKRLITTPLPEDLWTVEGLMGVGHNVLLASQYKAGKTQLLLNFILALVDNKPFLGEFPTVFEGNVCYLNYELTDVDLQQRLKAIRMRRPSRVLTVSIRDWPNPLGSARGREWLANLFLEHDIKLVVVDTFRAAYTGTSHNDNAEVGVFTRMLDLFKQEAACPGLVLAHHFGRKEHEQGEEHGQGAVELDNWCDMRYLLTKDAETEERFLRVEGRGPGLKETVLQWEAMYGRLRINPADRGVGRSKVGHNKVMSDVVDLIRARPGVNVTSIKESIPSQKAAITKALKDLEMTEVIRSELGLNRSLLYFLVNPDNIDIDFG